MGYSVLECYPNLWKIARLYIFYQVCGGGFCSWRMNPFRHTFPLVPWSFARQLVRQKTLVISSIVMWCPPLSLSILNGWQWWNGVAARWAQISHLHWSLANGLDYSRINLRTAYAAPTRSGGMSNLSILDRFRAESLSYHSVPTI